MNRVWPEVSVRESDINMKLITRKFIHQTCMSKGRVFFPEKDSQVEDNSKSVILVRYNVSTSSRECEELITLIRDVSKIRKAKKGKKARIPLTEKTATLKLR